MHITVIFKEKKLNTITTDLIIAHFQDDALQCNIAFTTIMSQ